MLVTGLNLVVGGTLVGCVEDDSTMPGVGATEGDEVSDAGGERFAYGAEPSQYGVLHRPAGTPVGVVVVIHGGFWKAEYDLSYGDPLARDLAERGWLAWNIEYRRVGSGAGGGGGVPETLDDVSAAIAHLDVLGDERGLGVDLTTVPIVGIGHSAGGHLATWAGAGGRLTHVISQAGVLDLIAAHDAGLGAGAVESFLGHPPGPDDRDVDPLLMAPLDVPVWCVHGRQDSIVPLSQSADYVDVVAAAGGAAELVEVDGDHFVVIDPASAAWDRTVQILEEITADR